MRSSFAKKAGRLYNFLRARLMKFSGDSEVKIMQKIVLLLQQQYSATSQNKVTVMNDFWFLADLPILLLAMGCYAVAGIWIIIEWKFRRPPASYTQHPANSSSVTITSRGRTITRASTHVYISSQKSKGQFTRELFFKCTVIAIIGRFSLMPVQAWYYHFDDFPTKNPESNLLCVPNSAGCVVSRTLPDVFFASAFFVLLILYAQLIAIICGVQMSPSLNASNPNIHSGSQQSMNEYHHPSNHLNQQQQSMNNNSRHSYQLYGNPHSTNNANHNNSAETTPERTANGGNNSSTNSPNNVRSTLTCHERILLRVMYHRSTFSTTNIIMYSVYGICLFFSAIIPIMSFSRMQQILWVMMSLVYAASFLMTLGWVIPSLYKQFHIKMADKTKIRQKLHFKMMTSSLICLFVYGGRTINFTWNLVRSWNGQFYSDNPQHFNHFTSFFNTSLGRDAVLNLCLELIPVCIIVKLMRTPTKKQIQQQQQQQMQQQQTQSSTPPIATAASNKGSPITPPTYMYADQLKHTQPGQMTRSMSARGSDNHMSHNLNISTSSASNNFIINNHNNPRMFDSVGMKRAQSAKAATMPATTANISSTTATKPTAMEHVSLLKSTASNETYGATTTMGDDKIV